MRWRGEVEMLVNGLGNGFVYLLFFRGHCVFIHSMPEKPNALNAVMCKGDLEFQ
jgi:hypothetical protein